MLRSTSGVRCQLPAGRVPEKVTLDVKDIGIPSRDSVDHTVNGYLAGPSHNHRIG